MDAFVLVMTLLLFDRSGPAYAGGVDIHHIPFESLELCEGARLKLQEEYSDLELEDDYKQAKMTCVRRASDAGPAES